MLDHTKTPWEITAIFLKPNYRRITFALNMASAAMFLMTPYFYFATKYGSRQYFESSYMNMSRTMTDKYGTMYYFSSNVNSYVDFITAYLHLILACSIFQDQGHAHFDNEYLGNSSREITNYQWTNQSYMGFRLTYLHFT